MPGPQVRIDTDAVAALAARVRSVSSELAAAGWMFDDPGDGVHHPAVLEALRSFNDRWSDKRTALTGKLEDAADALSNVVDQFRASDESLADGLADAFGEGGP